MTYIPKDYWMICDRCGGQYRRSGMREEWTGLWVCTRGCWEPRHPQDFVTGVEDDTTVPVSRPDVAQTMGTTTLSSSASQYAKSISVTSASGLSEDDAIGVALDNGTVFWSYITDVTGTTVTIGSALHGAAASGNTVYLPSINSENWSD